MSLAQINTIVENKENFTTIKSKILDLIKSRNSINEYQIKAVLNINRSTIIGRLSELQDEGVISVSGTFNGNLNSTYKYEPNINIQKTNRLIRSNERYQKWLKNAEKNNYLQRYANELEIK